MLAKLLHGVDTLGLASHGGPHIGRPAVEVFAVAGGWYPGPVSPLLATLVAFGLTIFGAFIAWKERPWWVIFCSGCAVAGLAMLSYVNGHWDPQAGIDRYGLVIVPFFVALASAGARVRAFGALLLLGYGLIVLPSLAAMPHSVGHLRSLSDPGLVLVEDHWHPGDGIAFASIYRFGYYIARGGDAGVAVAIADTRISFRLAGVQERIARTLPTLEATHPRLWYVGDSDSDRLLQLALDHSEKLLQQWETSSGPVRLYATP